MKVTIKKGDMFVTKDDFSKEIVENKMAEMLTEHEHICASCCSNECKGKRTLSSPLIEKGVSTLNRTYVFECRGYKKKLTLEDSLLLEKFVSFSDSTYQPTIYPIASDEVKKKIMRMK